MHGQQNVQKKLSVVTYIAKRWTALTNCVVSEQATRTGSQGEPRSSHAHDVTRTTAGSQLVLRASRNVGLGQRMIISVNHITDGRIYVGTFKTTNHSTMLLIFLSNQAYKTISDLKKKDTCIIMSSYNDSE